MKKTLLLAGSAALLCSAASAQSYRLTSINTDDDYEVETFSYDEQGRYNRFWHVDLDPYLYYDSLIYNEKDQIETDITYQDIYDTGEYRLVSKCCYGYDEQGHLQWRDNYNSFGGELSQSAHIVYEYDEEGRLIRQNQYWAFDLENPFMVIDYEYNAQGLLASTVDKMADFWDPTDFEEVSKVEYEYDEQGRRMKQTNFSIYQGEVESSTFEAYDYDADGNMTESRYCGPTGNVREKYVYHFDTAVDESRVYYPKSHEHSIGYTFGFRNMLTSQDIYMTDNNTDALVYGYTKHFTYEECGTTDLTQMSGRTAFVDADAKVLNLGNNSASTVNVYGTDGRLALSLNARGTADLSALPAGVYVATVKGAGGTASYHKFVIR